MRFDEALATLANLASLEAGKSTEKAEKALVTLLTCGEEDVQSLFAAAEQVRQKFHGEAVHLRGLIEFSNICRKNCTYCGLRRENPEAQRYRMTPEAIVETAQEAHELGYGTVVLQSGEDGGFSPEALAEVVRSIKEKTGQAITLSVGEWPEETYRLWREAGADRFLLRIETTDPDLFRALHPDDDLEKRKECLFVLKRLGYQLGSGFMVGLPGQTPAMIARDILWLRALGAEMIGVGPFIPHPETPLKDAEGGTVERTLKTIACLRLVFPLAHLPATTAMGSLHPLGRERALQAGANVVMPNVTPTENRAKYALYPGKICLGDEPGHCRGCIENRIKSIGRTLAEGPGHVLR